MNSKRKYLLGIVVFTILFAIIIICSIVLYQYGYKRALLVCSIPALLSILGQLLCLMLLFRANANNNSQTN